MLRVPEPVLGPTGRMRTESNLAGALQRALKSGPVPDRSNPQAPEEWMPWIDDLASEEGEARVTAATQVLRDGFAFLDLAGEHALARAYRRAHLVAEWLCVALESPVAAGIYLAHIAEALQYFDTPESKLDYVWVALEQARDFFPAAARQRCDEEWHAFARSEACMAT